MKGKLADFSVPTTAVILLTVFISTVLAQNEADLSVSVESNLAVVPVNTNFVYSITVENLGSDGATFVTVTDNLPTGIDFLSSPDACVVSGSIVECSVGDLAAGESVTVTYVVRAITLGDDVSNTVSVVGAEADPDNANNVASAMVDVVIPEPADISLSGSVSSSVIDMSDEIDIRFTVTNSDTDVAYLSVVEFVLPSQVKLVSSTDCLITGTVVNCDVGTVEHGTPEDIILTLRAVTPGNPVTISAIVSHFETDPDTADNGVNISFIVNEPPPDSADLEFSMAPSASQIIMGEDIDITYTVTNLGPSDATNVSVIDELPAEMAFVSSADCVITGNLVVCDIDDLAVNEVYTGSVTVTSNVEMSALSSSASAVGDEFDPNIFNNVQTITLPSIDPLVATPSPAVVTVTPGATATPFVITSTPLPTVEIVSPQSPVQPTPAPEREEEAGDEPPPVSGDDGSVSSSNPSAVNDPLPDDIAPSDIYGWTRYESIDLIQMTGQWHLRTITNASDDGYHESRDAGATLRYPFEGDGFRIGYRSEVDGAAIQVKLDDKFSGIIETDFMSIDPDLDPIRQTFVTQPYWVKPGYHVIDLVCLADGQRSKSCNVDYVEIFTGPPIPQSTQGSTPIGESAVIIDEIELVSAPPTIAPTGTSAPPSVVTFDVIVSVDLNANDQVDTNEGIEGITVRAVDVSDNTLLATSVTDSSGFVRITVSTTNDVILLIPILGESFYAHNRGEVIEETWNLLLDPANVPGLIP